jgi:hypothetical protein
MRGTTKTMCMQVSVDAGRWPDEYLRSFEIDGHPAEPEAMRAALRRLKDDGFDVVPCSRHICLPDGTCTGNPLTAENG